MSDHNQSSKLDNLFRSGKWEAARQLLERQRENDPENHWVLTQLGVTFYEQRRYQEALQLFLASLQIVPDCPLTLWNLAGALDSLGKSADALRIYTWLLQSTKSAEEDPCWESKEWTDALKTDCLYRLGVCFQHLGKKRNAEHCFREYLNLLSLGIDGSYSIDDVKRQMQELQSTGKTVTAENEIRKAVHAALKASGIQPRKGRQITAPEVNVREVLAGRRVASKR